MNLENEIIGTVHSAIADAIKTKLSGYNTPLDKLIAETVQKHDAQFRTILDKCVNDALSGDFAVALADACTRKLAKVLISKMEGALEKQATELRSSPEFRAKLTVLVDDLVTSMITKIPNV